MDARARHDRAHALLRAAREATGAGRPAQQIAALAEAVLVLAATEERDLRVRVAWRYAKAAHDAGDLSALSASIDNLLATDDTMADAGAIRAVSAISKRWWDTAGYRDDRPARLWLALSEHHRSAGDPWLAASAETQRTWHLACAGALDALDASVDDLLATDPRRFGAGPSRHPDAPDAPTSVWWAQLARLRTALWSAAWTGRPDRARDLLDALLDAADAAEVSIEADPWLIDPAMRAALTAGEGALIDRWASAWTATLSRRGEERAELHLALALGLTGEPDDAPLHLERAAAIAADRSLGPEWQVDALSRASERHPDPAAAQRTAARASALIERYGLGGLLPS